MQEVLKEQESQGVVEVSKEAISLEKEEEQRLLEEAMAGLNIEDRTTVLSFGSEAQKALDRVSQEMLHGVKNSELGDAGSLLGEMVSTIRGFDVGAFDPQEKLSWWKRLLGFTKPVVAFIHAYEEVRDQIDVIANDLERHKRLLLKDVISLDKLYDANLTYFHALERYIQAGEMALEKIERETIPLYEAQIQKAQESMSTVQALKDLRGFRDDLERRVQDLRLSRQVTMQTLPSIRLLQENNKSLIAKMNSTLLNTLPLWRNQLAQTVALFRTQDAVEATKRASDLTNELLERNAEGLREANAGVRAEMERGVFDMGSIERANETLIATLNDSLAIAKEGKRAREEAKGRLVESEKALKEALLSQQPTTPTVKEQ